MSGVLSAAVLGGLIGTFFGGFTKFLWEKWLPDWLTWRRTRAVARERQLSRVRAPAVRALSDLHERLAAIVRTQASGHRYTRTTDDPDYYLDSTTYLVARVFVWQEILRRRMSSYDYVPVYLRLEALTEAFANGYPGFQVLRLQQIEIGERMITGHDDQNDCMSYSEFLDIVGQSDPPRYLSRLRARVETLLERPAEELNRVVLVDQALMGVLTSLDPRRRWASLASSKPLDMPAVVGNLDGARSEIQHPPRSGASTDGLDQPVGRDLHP